MGRKLLLLVYLVLSGCFFSLEHPAIDSASTPLHLAASSGDLLKIESMISEGADVDSRVAGTEATPLHFAALGGQYETANFLIQHGADVNARTDWGSTPIHYSSGKSSGEGLTSPCTVSPGLSDGHYDVTELLIRHGADPNYSDLDGDTAIGEAAARNDIRITRLLIDQGVDLDYRGRSQYTPLQRAVARGPDAAILLVEAGADIHKGAKITKETPLHTAALCGYEQLVVVLLNNGANVHAKDQFGKTPLDHAKQTPYFLKNKDKTRIVKILKAAIEKEKTKQ